MAAVAHNKAFAKKVGIPQSVGKDFNDADKGIKFGKGGETMKQVDMKKNPGMAKLPTAVRNKMGFMKKGGTAMDAKEDMKMDKKVVKKAISMHDKQQHGDKKTDLATLKKGGMAVKKMAGGGLAAGHKAADGVATKGKTKGTMIKMSKGGRYC
jgi:hypothetical protein